MSQRMSGNKNVNTIEFIFRHEHEIREAVLESKLSPAGHIGGAPSGHSYVSDPTAIQALRNSVELNTVTFECEENYRGKVKTVRHSVYRPERWLKVIDAVKEWCNEDNLKAEIFKRRYKGEDYRKACDELHIGATTYHVLRTEIYNYALQCAAYLHVIKIF